MHLLLLGMTIGIGMTSSVASAVRSADEINATTATVFGSSSRAGSGVRAASKPPSAVALPAGGPEAVPARRRAQSSFPMWSMTVDENIVVGGGSSAHWVEALSWVGEGYPGLFVGTDFDFATCGIRPSALRFGLGVRHGFCLLFLKMRR